MKTEIFHTDYNLAPEKLRWEIAALLHKIWPDSALQAGKLLPTHRPQLKAQSVCCCCGGRLVGYAGVVQKSVRIGETTFIAAGLSCVAADPDWRGQGVGKNIVKSATEWIQSQSQIDLGVFTCHPALSGFYLGAGNWQVQPQAVLLGSEESGGLSSDSLDVDVLMRPFSQKATENWDWIKRSTIQLALPVGDFW